MASQILTNEEVREAIDVDPDYPVSNLTSLAETATSFIKNKTGYDFSKDQVIDPTAKACARLYVRQIHYGADGYNKEHDYALGIGCMIEDLKDIARTKKEG